MAAKAYAGFVDDLRRCEQLGVRLYNFHPGNTNGAPRPEAIGRIAAALNRSHRETSSVVTVLENMAGSGNTVGSSWEDLRDIIALVEDKGRVGVCIDTCHTFAAGYDLRLPEAFKATMEQFDKVVGLKYLKALHCTSLLFLLPLFPFVLSTLLSVVLSVWLRLSPAQPMPRATKTLTQAVNDSKAPLSSNRDLHANIGTGFLGLRAFHNVVNYPPFAGLPMVLETPIDRKGADGKSVEDRQVWADEIKLLEGLVGADPEGDEFKAREAELAEQGRGERAKFQDQADRKAAKGVKAAAKTAAKAVKDAVKGAGKKGKAK